MMDSIEIAAACYTLTCVGLTIYILVAAFW